MPWLRKEKKSQLYFYKDSNTGEVSRKEKGNHTVYDSKLYLDELCVNLTAVQK